MKKLIAVMLSVIVLVSMTSCGTPTPTETVDTFLQAVKTQDSDSLSTVYADKEMVLALSDFTEDDSDQWFDEDSLKKLFDFDYTLSNEKINEKKGTATVDVNVTTYNLGEVMTSWLNAFLSEALTLSFSGASEKQIDKTGENLLKEKLNNLEKTYKGKATVSLTKTDNGWIVDKVSEDSDLYNVLLGGAIKAVKDYEDMWDE